MGSSDILNHRIYGTPPGEALDAVLHTPHQQTSFLVLSVAISGQMVSHLSKDPLLRLSEIYINAERRRSLITHILTSVVRHTLCKTLYIIDASSGHGSAFQITVDEPDRGLLASPFKLRLTTLESLLLIEVLHTLDQIAFLPGTMQPLSLKPGLENGDCELVAS